MVLPLDSNALGASEWFICVALCQDRMLLCQGLTVQELQVDEVETGKTWKFKLFLSPSIPNITARKHPFKSRPDCLVALDFHFVLFYEDKLCDFVLLA